MAYPVPFGKARDQKRPFTQRAIISQAGQSVAGGWLRRGAAAHSLKAKWPRTQLLPADAMVMAPAAMLVVMMADAETQVHRSNVRADHIGACGAREGQGEKRGDNEFHS